MEIPESLNADYIDQQYQLWKKDPEVVSRDWQFFFKGFEIAGADGLPNSISAQAPSELPPVLKPAEGLESKDRSNLDAALKQSRVDSLIYRHRDLGHLLACLDPLASCPTDHPLLNISAFDLTESDLETEFYTSLFSVSERATLQEIIDHLRKTYCRSVGVEYLHLQDPAERRWLQERMEPVHNDPAFKPEIKVRILNKLCQATLFENYLNKKYIGQTRFSLEGAETIIVMLDALLLQSAASGCTEIILGMSHRGRLNVMTNILYKSYEEIFREFINSYDPDSVVGAGDVKYHNGYLTDIQLANQLSLKVFLVNNPSHLESVDPVVEGIAYARQDMTAGEKRNKVLPVLIHGDSAFAGQGVVAETLNLSQLEGYKTEGTLHIIINNQIGYTTLPESARSTRYSTDIAKMLMVPIFHIHGENPEAAVHVVNLAHEYRMTFGKDVVIDVICYRRFGHNEGDEPYFTQPTMYQRIKERPPLYKIYAEQLVENGDIKEKEVEEIKNGINQCLEEGFQAAQHNPLLFPKSNFYKNLELFQQSFSHEPIETGVKEETLLQLARQINTIPEGFNPHRKIKQLLAKRLASVEKGEGIDWAGAEALAFASLLTEGSFVRLSGQDSGRGTFSHRHAVLMDNQNGDPYVPLETVCEKGATFTVLDSSLSEFGVLGFDYGYSMIRPEGLTIWEAQFGDFANNAQSVIDLYIAGGETKWQRKSGLVLLLPHGMEGLGPEHSSARLERFLQLCARDNLQVCNMTTPAQYFHLLRRQVKSGWRKPLIIMSPKSLLRNPQAVSSLSAMTSDSFQEVIDDPLHLDSPKKVILCSGKIYYQLKQHQEKQKVDNIAIVRLEQFYPFPKNRLQKMVDRYHNTKEWTWVQEEPKNMGGWQFIEPRLTELSGQNLKYVGREPAASPATGFANIYKQEQADLLDKALA